MNTHAAFACCTSVQHELHMFRDPFGSCFQKLPSTFQHLLGHFGISSRWFWRCWNFLSSRFRIASRGITQPLSDFQACRHVSACQFTKYSKKAERSALAHILFLQSTATSTKCEINKPIRHYQSQLFQPGLSIVAKSLQSHQLKC